MNLMPRPLTRCTILPAIKGNFCAEPLYQDGSVMWSRPKTDKCVVWYVSTSAPTIPPKAALTQCHLQVTFPLKKKRRTMKWFKQEANFGGKVKENSESRWVTTVSLESTREEACRRKRNSVVKQGIYGKKSLSRLYVFLYIIFFVLLKMTLIFICAMFSNNASFLATSTVTAACLAWA